MVSLFCILFLGVSIFFIVRFVQFVKKSKEFDVDKWPAPYYIAMITIFSMLSVIFIAWSFSLINTVGTGATIDQKIAMYVEENSAIEESINIAVKSYMEFETSTYIELKDKDCINLVSLFPELNSNTLVQQQISVYIANNQKIKELKEEKIDLSKAKWKLYFGT